MAQNIHRLETPTSLFLSRWWSGEYTNRSPLFVPVTAMGIQLVERQDVLIGGLNVMVTPQFTLRRRPGFLKACSIAFGSSEWPLTYFSFQKLDGTILQIVDTQTNVYVFTSSTKTSIWTKASGAVQTSFNSVANMMYFCDGKNANKYDGTTVSKMGIDAPTITPTLSFNANGNLEPLTGYQYGYCYKNSTTDHISTMSPVSANTGPLNNQTIVEKHTIPATGPFTITVVNGATFLADGGVVYDSNNIKLTAVSSGPSTGQYVAGAAGVGTYTFAAADAGKVVDITYSFSLTPSAGLTITIVGDRSTDPQVDKVQIYRTKDGGSQFFFDAEIANPASGTWTFTDSTTDANLDNLIIAPVADANDPPPAGMSLLVWYGGRLWGASGNTLFFSAGPDATNGVGAECWPPGNNYTLPGTITALTATSQGLLIQTKDDAYVTTGNSSANFTTPNLWQANWGVASSNNVVQNGDTIYILTSAKQFFSYDASGKNEIGFNIADKLTAFVPANSYVAWHQSGEDFGVFISDGSANIYRYSPATTSWDTVMQPVGGCGAMVSMEMADANWRLLIGRATGSGFILERDTNTYADDGTAYSAYAIVGSITIAPPKAVAKLDSILIQAAAVGTYPTVSVMLNEINDTGTAPATFTTLPNPVPDPPKLPQSLSIWTKRHDLNNAQIPLPHAVQHLQVKILFATEAAASELFGLGID